MEPFGEDGGLVAAMEERLVDRIWEVIERTGICMFVTRFEDGVRARPLEARPDRQANLIWFLTDVRGAKDNEIARHHDVCLTFSYPKQKVYLSISGRAVVRRDPVKARELWNQEQYAWWPAGPEDENVRVIRMQPVLAEIWDGPASSAIAAYEFEKARLTGQPPDLGENRKRTAYLG